MSKKEHRKLLGDIEMLYIMIIVVETKIVYVKTHQHVLLKWVHVIIDKIHLHKMDLEKCKS